jgi:Integrase core domain
MRRRLARWPRRAALDSRRIDYNGVRPHSALANRTPEEFRAQHIAIAAANRVSQNFNPGSTPEWMKEGLSSRWQK